MNGDKQVLAIELSTPHGRLALVRGNEIRFSAEFASQRTHHSLLFDPLRRALQEAGDDLDLIVVGTGPGSYTGVRIAIAAAHGIALARGIPVIGWPSITVPEAAGNLRSFAVFGDARRNSYYFAVIDDGELRGTLELLDEPSARARLRDGSGLRLFSLDETLPPWTDGMVARSRPSAELLARKAAQLSVDQVKRLSEGPIEPCYVREAFVTSPKRPWLAV